MSPQFIQPVPCKILSGYDLETAPKPSPVVLLYRDADVIGRNAIMNHMQERLSRTQILRLLMDQTWTPTSGFAMRSRRACPYISHGYMAVSSNEFSKWRDALTAEDDVENWWARRATFCISVPCLRGCASAACRSAWCTPVCEPHPSCLARRCCRHCGLFEATSQRRKQRLRLSMSFIFARVTT